MMQHYIDLAIHNRFWLAPYPRLTLGRLHHLSHAPHNPHSQHYAQNLQLCELSSTSGSQSRVISSALVSHKKCFAQMCAILADLSECAVKQHWRYCSHLIGNERCQNLKIRYVDCITLESYLPVARARLRSMHMGAQTDYADC